MAEGKPRARGEVRAVAVAWWILGGIGLAIELIHFSPRTSEVADGIGIASAVALLVTSIGVYQLRSWARWGHIVLNGLTIALGLFILGVALYSGNLFPPSQLLPVGVVVPLLVALFLIYPVLAVRILLKGSTAAQFRGDFSQVPVGAGATTWLKRVGIGAAIATVVFGALAASIRARGDREWSAFLQDHDVVMLKLKSDLGQRVPLVGPAHPGNSWDDLAGILTSTKQLDQDGKDGRFSLEKLLAGATPDPVQLEKGRKLLAAAQPLLEKARIALKSERGAYPLKWERSFAAEIPPLLGAQRLGSAFGFSAWQQWQENHPEAALDEIAFCLQLAIDFQRPPVTIDVMIGNSLVNLALEALRGFVADPACTTASLERIESMLARTELQFTTASQMMEFEFANMGVYCRLIESGQSLGTDEEIPTFGFIQWAFSRRIPLAEAGRFQYRHVEETRRCEALPWNQIGPQHFACEEEISKSGNLFATSALVGTRSLIKTMNECRAKLRVVRGAAQVRLGKNRTSPGWPVDPFNAEPLGLRVDATSKRIFSTWMDGKEGTKASWKPAADDEDLALDVK